MKRFYGLLSASLVLSSLGWADGSVYKALINNKIQALVRVNTSTETDPSSTVINGVIIYDKSGSDEIGLGGTTATSGQFKWQESIYNRETDKSVTTGFLMGMLTQDGKQGSGTWTNAKGDKVYPLTLTRIAWNAALIDNELHASVTYPQFEDPELIKLNEMIEDSATQDYEKNREFVRDLVKNSDPSDPSSRIEFYSADTNCEVESVIATNVSLSCTFSNYSGGAHGNYNLFGRNYILNPNNFKDIQKDPSLWNYLENSPEFLENLSKQIVLVLKQNKASSILDGDEAEFIKNFKFGLVMDTIPFVILPAGIAFEFSPYEVGSYAEGAYRAIIPNSFLNSNFKKDGPLASRNK